MHQAAAVTIGIEEELLLVSGETGRPLSVAGRVLCRAEQLGWDVEAGANACRTMSRAACSRPNRCSGWRPTLCLARN